MSVIDELIYDRTAEDVARLIEIKQRIMRDGFNTLSASERVEYLAGMKGAYNHTDMNRVGNAVLYLAERLIEATEYLAEYRAERYIASSERFDLPYKSEDVAVDPKVDWTVFDIPTQEDIKTYLANLSNLRKLMPLPSGTPYVPSTLNNMNYTTANNIEKLLTVIDQTLTRLVNDLQTLINRAVLSTIYSDEVFAGEI